MRDPVGDESATNRAEDDRGDADGLAGQRMKTRDNRSNCTLKKSLLDTERTPLKQALFF